MADADGKRSYEIVINGVKESVDAVESLNKQLDALEKKIDSLSSKAVNVSAGSNGTGKKTSVSALSEEEKLTRQILQLDEKREAYQQQLYQSYLASKDLLKETLQDQKQLAASERLTADQYTNTMAGMKQQLADIKAVMQTVDLSDTDQFDKLTQKANELTNKLKEIEESYGQYGRNVGNYANGVAEGLQKVSIQVGDTTREFANAREASRTLNNELKSMALNGQQNTEEYKKLNEAVKQLNSTLKDVETSSVAMDNLLDTMQGITALASMSEGISAIFGLDDSKIQETIQRLVALQNVLQGLETIRKQMQTQEGIGLLLSKGNKAIDKMAASIVGVGTASKGATLAVKALSTALKGIGIGIAVALISTLVTKIGDWIDKQKEAKKQAEELRKETNKMNASLQVTRIQMQNSLATLNAFNGSKKEEQAIVKDLNSKYGSALGTYKTIAQWKDALKKKTDAYIESLKLEAEMQAALKRLEDAYIKQREAQNYEVGFLEGLFEGEGAVRTRVRAVADQTVKEAEQAVTDIAKRLEANNKKNQINIFSPQDTKTTTNKIRSDGKKVEDAVRQAQNNINDLRIKLMKDGLAKQLMQLDDENRKEIEKIRKNGQKVEEQLALQEQVYQQERKKILSEYSVDTFEIISDTQLKNIDNAIQKLDNLAEAQKKVIFTYNAPASSKDNLYDFFNGKYSLDRIQEITDIYKIRNDNWSSGNYKPYLEELKKYYAEAEDIQKEYQEIFDKSGEKAAYDWIAKQFEAETVEIKNFLTKYGDTWKVVDGKIVQTLSDSFSYYMYVIDNRYRESLELTTKYINEKNEQIKSGITTTWKNEVNEVEKQLSEVTSEFESNVKLPTETQDYYRQLRDQNKESYTEREQMMIAYVNRIDALTEKLISINDDYTEQLVKADREAKEEMQANNQIYYQEELTALDEYLQKAGQFISSQPEKNKFGFVDLKKTKANYNEVLVLYRNMLDKIAGLEVDLNTSKINGEINAEQYNEIFKNLQYYKGKVEEEVASIGENIKRLPEEWWKGIDAWVQIVGQAATQIIQSIGQINDAAFEKQMEALEKQTEALEEQLNKQKELTQKYADDVEGIEDELSTARGDRRQHLIDQLNAQMQAQRESLAQEKAIEKEQERMEKKKEKMEEENNKRRKAQAITTALINAALAISNAAVNKWPIPALPMIALATAMGAAQVAAVRAAKYADGGVLVGKSHRQGGIKLLNGYAEAEGGEYITNKRTTSRNVDLLDYINSKKRRIDLSDMIEFYSYKPRKTIKSISKRYFEDGGYVPTLRTDIDINDRVVNAMERYADKPTYVSVVDIINKSDDVRRVQTLAGLE